MSANVSEIIPQKVTAEKVPLKMWGIDSRFVAPILITLILLGGQISFGILESYPQTLTAIACCDNF